MVVTSSRPRVAKWIGHPNGGGYINWPEACLPGRALVPTPVFRKRFVLDQALTNAQLFVTGLGYFDVRIDGCPVTDARLQPAPTSYDRRWRYKRFALPVLAAGGHVVSVLVGNGFYCEWQRGSWNFDAAPWIDHPKMFLELEDAMGKIVLASDETWKAKFSPIVCSGLRGGEDYDARLEFPEDETEGEGWFPALVKPSPGGVGEEEIQPPCRVVETHPLVRIPGTDVWRAPVAVAGVPRLTVRGARGAKVTLRCGEYHRTIDDRKGTTNEQQVAFSGEALTGAKGRRWQVDSYVLKGEGEEVWSPLFTYHGFDRVEATVEGEAEIVRLEALVVRTDFAQNGRITTSDVRLRRLYDAASRTALGNFVGIPTDCPHREKIGWMSEARIQSEFLLYGWKSDLAHAAYVDDIADVQRPSGELPAIAPTGGWGFNWGTGPMWWCAFPLIADSLGRFTGDWSVARRTLEAQKRQSAFLVTMTGADGLIRFGLPDWCIPNETKHLCPNWFSTTAFAVAIHAKTADFCARFGDADGERACRARAAAGVRALRKTYYRGGGRFSSPNTTMHALALEYGIVPAEDRAACAAELNRIARENGCRPDYGTGGAACVVRQLFDNGYADTAFEYMVQPECPGYQVWFDRWHLTTMPESWDPDRTGPGADSRFHGVYSCICDSFYRSLAGFRHDPDLDGAREIRIRPCFPTRLNDFAAEHEGFRVSWKREANGDVAVEIEVPSGKTAEVVLPGRPVSRIAEGVYTYRCPRTVIPTHLSEVSQNPYWAAEGFWDRRHIAKLKEIATGPREYDCVFVGDSITHNWEGWSETQDVEKVSRQYAPGKLRFANGPGRAVWEKLKSRHQVLNLGVAGDCTQHVLWRLEHGELTGFRTRYVSLMIGANNNDPIPDVIAGVRACVTKIRELQPQAVVLLAAVLPSHEKAFDPRRTFIRHVNDGIRKLADCKTVVWIDFGASFLMSDGSISVDVMPDFIHPLESGYRTWSAALEPYLGSL